MNLILFNTEETSRPLPRVDRRAIHLLDVLKRRIGDTFDAGLINGPRGKGRIATIGERNLALEFSWGTPPPPLEPLELIVGLPRPQTARKILHEATSLGVSAIHFATVARGEPSYGQSTLWSSGEWLRHVIAGAEQAFSTHLPEVTWGQTLEAVLQARGSSLTSLALDNYEATTRLGEVSLNFPQASAAAPVLLAFGAERGWTGPERDLLRARGFTLVHLGERVLRTETAIVTALAIVQSKRGRM